MTPVSRDARTVAVPHSPPTLDTGARPGGAPSADRAAFAVALAFGAIVRLWQLVGREPRLWSDSPHYLEVARSGWLTSGLWAGNRVPVTPVLLKLVGGSPTAFVALQAGIAVVCWAWLASVVGAPCADGARRWLPVVATCLLSIADEVTLWDRSVMSETVSIALLAALCASVLVFWRQPTTGRLLALVAVAAAWTFSRDVHSVATLVVGLGLVGGFARRRSGDRPPRQRLILGGLLLLVAVASLASASIGGRGEQPQAHVYAVRILPYPDRVAWFREHGMPAVPEVRTVRSEGGAPVYGLHRGKAGQEDWWRWFDESGSSAFVRWLATHPTYVLTEPALTPERVYYSHGARTFYRGAGARRLPLLDTVLWPRTGVLIGGLVMFGIVRAVRWRREGDGRRWDETSRLGLLLVAVTPLVALVAWHGDGMESSRHLMSAAIQARLGALLMAVGFLSRLRPTSPNGATPTSARTQVLDRA
ncbi:MAG: hypothetical protein JWM47_3455 [Acidimicrobiales bacterium]|nr:hypothetical protein [Acidimicrobiales bacterium]